MRLGMLGMWHVHATGLVRQIGLHPEEFQLVAGYDADEAVRAARRSEWAGLVPEFACVTTPEELFDLDLDGVLVEGRIEENVALARRAVERGLPVLLEKPAGVDFAAFRGLHDLAAERGVHVQMAYLFRAMPAVRAMLELARSGALGELYRFHARLPKERSLYDEFVRDLGGLPGGMFFEMAGHLVDFLVTVAGQPQAIHPVLRHHHPRQDQAEERHSGAGAFVDNAVVVLECGRLLATLESTALEVVPGMRRIELFGSRGAVVIPHLGSGHLGNFPKQPYEVYLAETERWERFEPDAVPLQIADLREFRAVVCAGKTPEYSAAHDLAVQETLVRCVG
jgi:predicted dehydrogenase